MLEGGFESPLMDRKAESKGSAFFVNLLFGIYSFGFMVLGL